MKIEQKYIDGSTLLGVSLSMFALRGTNPLGNWHYWGMVVVSVIFLILSVIKYLEK